MQGRGQHLALGLCLQQAGNAVCGLATGVGIVAIQAVQPGTRMGVKHQQRRFFFGQMLQNGNQHRVFEHIGMVARVKGVAVTEHRALW